MYKYEYDIHTRVHVFIYTHSYDIFNSDVTAIFFNGTKRHAPSRMGAFCEFVVSNLGLELLFYDSV